MRLFFCLVGPVKPYVRMTRRGKYVNPQAQQYLASKEALCWQLKGGMIAEEYPRLGREPLRVEITFGWVNHRQDLDNLVKAVLDACNGIVWEDDRWVDVIEARREERPGQSEFIWVWVEPVRQRERRGE